MAIAAKTADDLISDLIVAAQLRSSDSTTIDDGRLSNAEALRIASRLLSTQVAALLVAARQERWVSQASDVAITSGTDTYRVPGRALAAGVSDVVIYDDASGEEFDPPYLDGRDRHHYVNGRKGQWRSPYAYTWQGDHIVLVPAPTETKYQLRVRFPRQPPRLVQTSACALVSSTTATTITTNATVPSAWASSETLDIVQGDPHGDVIGLDLAGTSISGTSITIAAGVPSEAASGDYVCLDGDSCVIPLPESVYSYLVDLLTVWALQRIGDPLAEQAKELAMATRASVQEVLEPRSRGERRVPIRRHSPLRLGRYPYRRS